MPFPLFTNEQMYAIVIFGIVYVVITKVEMMILEGKIDILKEEVKVLKEVVSEINKSI